MDSKWALALVALAIIVFALSKTGLPAISSITQSTNNSFQIFNR